MLIAAVITGILAVVGLLGIFATGAFFSRAVGVPSGTTVAVLAISTIALSGGHPAVLGVFGVVAAVSALLAFAAYGT